MKKAIKIIGLILALSIAASVLSGCFVIADFGQKPDDSETPGNSETPDNNEKPDDSGDGENSNPDTEEKEPYFKGRQSILLIGRSNMAGRGYLDDVEAISDDRILMQNESLEWVKMQEA